MKYYAIINDNQIGPMELPELAQAGLMPDTYVWCKGMADWQRAEEVADICRYFRNRIFDLMHPTAELPAIPGQAERAEVMPMADEDYKGLNRRDFYAAVNEQITHTYSDPQEEKMKHGAPPAALSGLFLTLSILLFFPLGIAALLSVRKSKKQWEAGMVQESFRSAASAKMYAGLAVSIGVILLSVLLQRI